MSSADGVSRNSQPHSVEFATPKARMFHLLKYGNKSASSALSSVSGQDRMTASMRYNQALSVETHPADVHLSHGLNMLSPQSLVTSSFNTDTVDDDTSASESTNRLSGVTQKSFPSQQDEACMDRVSCFYRSSSLQR